MTMPGGPQPAHPWGFEERTCSRCMEVKGGSPFRFCECQRKEEGLGDKQPHGAPEFSKGHWVAQLEVEQPHFGVVKDMFSLDNEWFVNISMWTYDGKNPGRLSPPEGGPTKYEPACPAKNYQRIEAPHLPLDERRFTLNGGYSHLLKFYDGSAKG